MAMAQLNRSFADRVLPIQLSVIVLLAVAGLPKMSSIHDTLR